VNDRSSEESVNGGGDIGLNKEEEDLFVRDRE